MFYWFLPFLANRWRRPGSYMGFLQLHSKSPRGKITEVRTVAQFRFRILVVDDEPSIRETARQILESGGYEVLTAA